MDFLNIRPKRGVGLFKNPFCKESAKKILVKYLEKDVLFRSDEDLDKEIEKTQKISLSNREREEIIKALTERKELNGLIARIKEAPIRDEDLSLFEFSDPFAKLINTTESFLFDNVVRASNIRLQTKKVCRQFCQSDECKQLLLMFAIIGQGRKFESDILSTFPDGGMAALSQLIMSTSPWFPQNGFAYPSAVLMDRNPLNNQKQGGLGRYYKIVNWQKALQLILSFKSLQGREEQLKIEGEAFLNYNIDTVFELHHLTPKALAENGIQTIPLSSPDHPFSPLNPRKKRPLIKPCYPL